MSLLSRLRSVLGREDPSRSDRSERDVGVTVERHGDRDGAGLANASESITIVEPELTDDEDDLGDEADEQTAPTEHEKSAASETDAAASTGSLTDFEGDSPAEPGEVVEVPVDRSAAAEVSSTAETADRVEPADEIEGTEPADEVEGVEPADEVEGVEPAGEVEGVEPADEVEGVEPAGEVVGVEPAGEVEGVESADEVEAVEPGDGVDDGGDAPVIEVSGIGPAYRDRLADAGVETVTDLRRADPSRLAEETDVSEKRIERWLEAADGSP